jgi:hypothetical protein
MERTIENVDTFREAVVADGWTVEATYDGYEPLEQAWTARKNGFSLQAIARPSKEYPNGRVSKEQAHIHAWGPDSLAVPVPEKYSMETLANAVNTCNCCGAKNVETFRYSFAGRACATCLPELKKKTEYPGWTE